MKIAEVSDKALKDFCGIYDDESDELLQIAKASALARIKSFTKLTQEEIDTHPDITTAYMVLVNDAIQNRDYTLSWQKQINPLVSEILHAYAENYL